MRYAGCGVWLARRLIAVLAGTILSGAASAQPGPATAKFSEAFERFRVGDFQAALSGFRDGLALEPANGLAHFYAGETQSRLQNHSEALQHYERAASLLAGAKEGELASERARELKPLLPWLGRWHDAMMRPVITGEFRRRGAELIYVVEDPGYLGDRLNGGIRRGDILFKGTLSGSNTLVGVFLANSVNQADWPLRATFDPERGHIQVRNEKGFPLRLVRAPQ